ncbi:protein mushroom body miniature, partial [Lucilia sericata]|uniref:protein mushroom body miniature n=1 Tax=Lucilia sericata TaxID=13632 RepID=UPI0018A87DD1
FHLQGHTSFQCQMICKNCSAPYHGYRTCPKPANLSTMMQLFMEFCMQQLQSFSAEKQIPINLSESVPVPQIDTAHPSSNKSNKLKRKQTKANEFNTKMKASKKRKVSVSKKKSSKNNSDDSSDDDTDDNSDSESTTESQEEDSSDSAAGSLVSSKKKLKMKSKNALKTPFKKNETFQRIHLICRWF